MASRRFTRLTNGYSKKFENHCAAVALWIAFYNFCRVHETLRSTPAIALGVADSRLDDRRADRRSVGVRRRAAVAASNV
jgi:hypothetical protein